VLSYWKVHTRFWCGDLRETGHLEEIGVDDRAIFKWIFKTQIPKGDAFPLFRRKFLIAFVIIKLFYDKIH